MKKSKIIVLVVFVSILFVLAAGFFSWTQFYYKPTDNALSYLVPDDSVNVEIDGDIRFTPKKEKKDTGFIFYPGGKVDERAYSYIGHELAKHGYTVVIAKMPLRLAIFKTDAAGAILDRNIEIEKWYIGGHSLGGTAAAIFTASSTDTIEGIVFLASYPAGSSNLSKTGLPAVSITGSNDGIVDMEGVEKTKNLLPSNTVFVEIKGGNHSQFGDYGLQDGDNNATVSIEEQHAEVIENILMLLKSGK